MEREKSQRLKRQEKKKTAFSQANFFSYLIILKNGTEISIVTQVRFFISSFLSSVPKYKYVNNAMVSTPLEFLIGIPIATDPFQVFTLSHLICCCLQAPPVCFLLLLVAFL